MNCRFLLLLLLTSSLVFAISEDQAKNIVRSYLDTGESTVQMQMSYRSSTYWIVDVYSGERRSFTVLIADETSKVIEDNESMLDMFKSAYKAQWALSTRSNDLYTLKSKNDDLQGRLRVASSSIDQAQESGSEFDFSKITQTIDDIIFKSEDTDKDITDAIDIEDNFKQDMSVENLDDLFISYQKVYDDMYSLAENADYYVDLILNKSIEVGNSKNADKENIQTLLKPPLNKPDSSAFKADALKWKREIENKDKECSTEANKSAKSFVDRKMRKDAENAVKAIETKVTSLVAVEYSISVCGIDDIDSLKELWSEAQTALTANDYSTALEKSAQAETLATTIQELYQKCSFPTPTPSAEGNGILLPAIVIIAIIGGAYYYYTKQKKEPKVEMDELPGARI